MRVKTELKIVALVFVALSSSALAWTDNNPTTIRKSDMDELRTYINAIRANVGLSAYSWTDSVVAAGSAIKRTYFQDMRTALEAVATATGSTAPQWGDTLAAGNTIKLLYITGTRNNITVLNTTINSWYCCGSYGGQNTGSVGACPGSDDSGCGTIDCDGLNYYFTEGSASPTGTNYCKLRDYADLTSGRCEGINDCKDANTGDCTSYGDSTVATCGTCKYATGACSSCTNYGAGTDTGTCRECNGAGSEQAPADDADCGTIDCDGLNYYFTEGSASATGTNYCKLRDYADLTSSRCEGLGDCKDANTGDCTGYGDSYIATCGTCCYATGACSSCTNYGSGTQGPTADYYYNTGTQGPTTTETCYLRDYHCTGSSCGETYGDSAQTSCGTCCYMSGCSGGSAGSCAAYGSGTQGPTGDYYYASGNTCYYRNYYCTGSSCGETYSDSNQITCNSCQYLSGCSGGSSGYCSDYSGGSNNCYTGSYGGYTWYYKSDAEGQSCNTVCGYWGKSCASNPGTWGNSINDCTKAVAVFAAVGISETCTRNDNHASYPGHQYEYHVIWPSVPTTCEASAGNIRICVCS